LIHDLCPESLILSFRQSSKRQRQQYLLDPGKEQHTYSDPNASTDRNSSVECWLEATSHRRTVDTTWRSLHGPPLWVREAHRTKDPYVPPERPSPVAHCHNVGTWQSTFPSSFHGTLLRSNSPRSNVTRVEDWLIVTFTMMSKVITGSFSKDQSPTIATTGCVGVVICQPTATILQPRIIYAALLGCCGDKASNVIIFKDFARWDTAVHLCEHHRDTDELGFVDICLGRPLLRIKKELPLYETR
ncbi:hypothetical protein KCV05_g285, partial [Aureobasidium melanogenum]